IDGGAGEGLDLVGLQRRVGAAEVDRLVGERVDPTPRADRLIVDLRARLDLLEVLEPLLIDRIGEGRPGAGKGNALEPPARPAAAAARITACDRHERDGERERPRPGELPDLRHQASPPLVSAPTTRG